MIRRQLAVLHSGQQGLEEKEEEDARPRRGLETEGQPQAGQRQRRRQRPRKKKAPRFGQRGKQAREEGEEEGGDGRHGYRVFSQVKPI
jgi:hypothetical protein